jgi:hypothetical protein
MRGKGINYDTGFSPGGHDSREHFDAGIVRGEMRVIALLHLRGRRRPRRHGLGHHR